MIKNKFWGLFNKMRCINIFMFLTKLTFFKNLKNWDGLNFDKSRVPKLANLPHRWKQQVTLNLWNLLIIVELSLFKKK